MCRSGVIPEHWPSGGLRYPGRVIAREGGLDQPGTGPTFPSGLPGGGCSLDNAKRPRHPLYEASATNTRPARRRAERSGVTPHYLLGLPVALLAYGAEGFGDLGEDEWIGHRHRDALLGAGSLHPRQRSFAQEALLGGRHEPKRGPRHACDGCSRR